MNRLTALLLSGVAACADNAGSSADAGPIIDAPAGIDVLFMPGDARVMPDARPQPDSRQPDALTGPYRHTITIDGTNDFSVPDNKIATTTSPAYNAYVSWDEDALYIGHDGDDLAGADPDRWFLVYIDVDPASSAGAEVGETFGTQSPGFPVGFHADFTWKLRLDGGLARLRRFKDPGSWTDATDNGGVTFARKNRFVEIRLPWTGLVAARPDAIGVITLFANEDLATERAYAGLYTGSFVDGYYPEIPISAYLHAELTAPTVPSSPDNRRP